MSDDFKAMFEQKSKEYDELDQHFQVFQDQTNQIIKELEDEVKHLNKKNQTLSREMSELKERNKTHSHLLEKELELIKRQKNDFQTKFYEFQKQVVDLENINESLENQIRAERSMLNQYETRVERTMQELALLQTQLEQNKSANQQQMARLKSQLKETQQELYVVHLKAQKHHDESQKRSRMSQMSISSRGAQTRRLMQQEVEPQPSGFAKKQHTPSHFSQNTINPGASFYKTLDLMNNLMGDLDSKMNKLKAQRKALAIN